METIHFRQFQNNNGFLSLRGQRMEMAMPAATQMRAAVLDAPGAPFRLTEIARPVPGAGEVLVRIKASGVNPLDLKIQAGQAAHARQPLPAVLGIDLAGVVEAVGPGVSAFRRGDEVFGMTGGVGGLQGSLAEYAAVDADLLAPKPPISVCARPPPCR
jgi:NADPH:quinone reductase